MFHVRQEIALEDPPEEIPEDYDPVVLARRKWFVPYWDLTTALGSSVDDLRNPSHICKQLPQSMCDPPDPQTGDHR